MPIFLIDTLKAKNNGSFALLDDADLKGGFRAVADATARDAIPTAKRSAGMLVYTVDDTSFWILGAGLTNGDWAAANFGGGGFTAGGDLSGDATSQTVERIKGTAITTAGGALTAGHVLVLTGPAEADWQAPTGGSFTPGGDLAGDSTNQTVTQLTGSGGSVAILASEVVNQSTTEGRTRAYEAVLHTTNNVTQSLASFVLPNNSMTLIEVEVISVQDGATFGTWWKRSRAFLNTGGTITSGALRSVDSEMIGVTPPGTWTLGISIAETAAQVLVNSDNDDVTWYLVSQRITVVPA